MPKILVAVAEGRLTAAATAWIEAALFDGALAIDATVGNGYDALFLAHRVGPTGKVLGFDVQKAALAGAREILKFVGSIDRVALIHDSHSRLADYLPAGATIQGAMFNLGYLPRGNRQIITKPDTTVSALRSVLEHLAERGRVTLLVYRGHEGGVPEYNELRRFLEQLSEQEWIVEELVSASDSPIAPRLFRIVKKSISKD
ncbi:MAG: class I SAM-dependent methyltransferase [Verrucomicrobia bacterium]|nr:class I SAM-dependent methyltransferase [Verrucomicrobiota bacterium]MBV9642132.1 class I SAM-dependent methyltransferase [Verrucomicrobiota bacterium]